MGDLPSLRSLTVAGVAESRDAIAGGQEGGGQARIRSGGSFISRASSSRERIRRPRLNAAIAVGGDFSAVHRRIAWANAGSNWSAHSSARIQAKAVLKWVPTRIG